MINGLNRHSTNDDISTPLPLFARLDEEFRFTVDAAASPENHRLDHFWTVVDNGLSMIWTGESVFCNPPYSECRDWVAKAWRERTECHAVLLLPVRTSVAWFHDFVLGWAELRFIRGRLQFREPDEHGGSAPFDSMLAIYGSKENVR